MNEIQRPLGKLGQRPAFVVTDDSACSPVPHLAHYYMSNAVQHGCPGVPGKADYDALRDGINLLARSAVASGHATAETVTHALRDILGAWEALCDLESGADDEGANDPAYSHDAHTSPVDGCAPCDQYVASLASCAGCGDGLTHCTRPGCHGHLNQFTGRCLTCGTTPPGMPA